MKSELQMYLEYRMSGHRKHKKEVEAAIKKLVEDNPELCKDDVSRCLGLSHVVVYMCCEEP